MNAALQIPWLAESLPHDHFVVARAISREENEIAFNCMAVRVFPYVAMHVRAHAAHDSWSRLLFMQSALIGLCSADSRYLLRRIDV
jgi:hypothetical protein